MDFLVSFEKGKEFYLGIIYIFYSMPRRFIICLVLNKKVFGNLVPTLSLSLDQIWDWTLNFFIFYHFSFFPFPRISTFPAYMVHFFSAQNVCQLWPKFGLIVR
jgi:hypothetical protein